MTVNKELYRSLYKKTCRGMGHVNRGSSSRYELFVQEPTQSLWRDIQEQTYASGQDLEIFLQGTRGNYREDDKKVDFVLKLGEVLPGEIIRFVFSKTGESDPIIIELLKLNNEQYIIVRCQGPSLLGAIWPIKADTQIKRMQTISLPTLNNVVVLYVSFVVPTSFHRQLDIALLSGFRQKQTAQDICPLLEWLKHSLSSDITREQLDELLQLTAELGVSTFVIRKLIDCFSHI